MLDPFMPENPDHVAHLKTIQEEIHSGFKDVVTESRGDKLKNPDENQVFSGKFWAGKTAISLGLIDGISSLHDKMTALYGEEFKLIEIKTDKRSFFEKYVGLHAENIVSDLRYHVIDFLQTKLK